MQANQRHIERLILGTVQLGLEYGINNVNGKPSEANALALLNYAKRNGIRYLDSAENYGNAHQIIGTYAKTGAAFDLFTKFTVREGFSVTGSIEAILKETHLSTLAGISFHRYEDLDGFNDWKSLKEAKNAGLIKNIGVSIYNEDQFKRCLSLDSISLIQIPFNLFDHSNEKRALMKTAKDRGILLHVRSVFLQGILFKNPLTLPNHLSGLAEPLKRVAQIANEHSITIEKLALGFPYLFPEIDGVLIGVETIEQLEKNLQMIRHLPDLNDLKEKILSIQVKDRRLLDPSQWNSLKT